MKFDKINTIVLYYIDCSMLCRLITRKTILKTIVLGGSNIIE